MNEFTFNQLKIVVEKAVRPVRASTARKRDIRQELLAHLTAVFEAEHEMSGDERTALDRTVRRFGDPAELTEQLRASVPVLDAFGRLADFVWFRPGESNMARGLRYLVLWSLTALLFLPAWYSWVQAGEWIVRATGWPPEEPGLLLGGPVRLLDAAFFMFTFVVLVWSLPRLDRTLGAAMRCHREWESLEVG